MRPHDNLVDEVLLLIFFDAVTRLFA